MSKQKIKNKIYALIIVVTLFVSVNNLSQAEEKSTIAGTEELTNTNNVDNTTNDTANKDEVGDDKKTISNGYTEDEIEMINDATNKKKQDFSKVEFLTIEEGLCVQCMHIGAYDDEPTTDVMMDRYLDENGYENDLSDDRRHHEIYLSDARRVAPEKLKTVIRHPIKAKGD